MKNLLLAGSTGYLGKHVLLHFLNEGYQISIIVNSKTKLYKIEYAINKVNIINI
jgi:nucleoside-diphosphate-sugar epimerase